MTEVSCIECAQNAESSSAIFKLDVDCLHEILDYLSQNDIIAISQTCKRLQRVAGDFFRTNYIAKMARGENDGIYISSIKSNAICQYIQKISIKGDQLKAYQFVGENCTSSIKYFRVYGALPDGGFELLKELLKTVEVFEFNECFIEGEFFENCLKYCQNIKTLSVTRSDRIRDKSIIIGSGNEWLLQKFPKLQNFELTESYKLKTNELKVFFEQNPNIKNFSTDSRTLWENRSSFMDSNAKLEKLTVDVYQTKTFDLNDHPISMIDCIYYLLYELYKRDFYRRLQFFMIFISPENVEKLISLHGIEMICGDVVRFDKTLTHVNMISIWCGDEILNLNDLPSKLPNLEKAGFAKISFKNILPFIRQSPKLRKFKIKLFLDKDLVSIDLILLNKEREKLVGARNLIIYVEESIYLATKWKFGTTNFNLIELRRSHAMEWDVSSIKFNYFKSL